jgi:hypothetical protein
VKTQAELVTGKYLIRLSGSGFSQFFEDEWFLLKKAIFLT